MAGRNRREATQIPPIAALAALEGAQEARSNPVEAEKALRAALALAPDDIDIRLAAYRFYFYNHRFADALHHAEFIIAHAARRLNIPVDWRAVRPGDAAFDDMEAAPGLYLQALVAWGYCQVRRGDWDAGREALAKAASLDANDRFGARLVLAATEPGDDDDDDADN